jgi:arginine-tRNA-protein transferase
MTRPLKDPLQFFFGTLPQPCPYLPGRIESKVVTELTGPNPASLHDDLAKAGFRRSHMLVYKPACPACNACVPVRVPVGQFRPGRSHRRVLRRNVDLAVGDCPPHATSEQYALFARYQATRHGDGGMAAMDFTDYQAMVEDSAVETVVYEFRDAGGRLIGVALTDHLDDGLSGVYKFFDPDQAQRSAGTHMVLWLIEKARGLGLDYVYLGYWIADCSKMSYKTRFSPIEGLGPHGWRLLEVGAQAAGDA